MSELRSSAIHRSGILLAVRERPGISAPGNWQRHRAKILRLGPALFLLRLLA